MMPQQSSRKIGSRITRVAILLATCAYAMACQAGETHPVLRAIRTKGGLCVQLGGGDGKLTAQLAQEGGFLVHRLDNDRARVARVRRFIESQGLYGPVSVEHWGSQALPHADHLANVVVVDDLMGIPKSELMRVLCPNGVACVKQGDAYEAIRKPRPSEMDEWTHPWHGSDGNMVSQDTYLGNPNGVQWLAGPLFPLDARKSSAQGLVSANGRVFYVTQNELSNLGPGANARPNYLVARDAFNGLRLWKRTWQGPNIAGTSNVGIVAIGGRVYGANGSEVVVLDGGTGTVLDVYPTGQPPEKILYSEGLLVAAASDGLTVFDTSTGKKLWQLAANRPYGTVVDGGRIFCIVGTREKDGRWLHEVLGVDLDRGRELWRQPARSEHAVRNSSALRIHFATQGILCIVDKRLLRVLSAENGREIWSKRTRAEGRNGWDTRLVGHFFGQGLVWMRRNDSPRLRKGQEVWQGLDPMTGEVKREIATSGDWPRTATPAKMGCQPLMATERFIMFPRQATYVDFATGQKHSFKFARGGCVLGAVPANGLAYVTPHACGCFTETIRGFIGLTSSRQATEKADVQDALERGPIYGSTLAASIPDRDESWPTYRRDFRRSGATTDRLPRDLRLLWAAQVAQPTDSASAEEWKLRVGNPITSPVIAEGKALVAFPEAHRVVAVDAATGKQLWHFTAGGRIDAPPTIHDGMCLFGAHDGWVYCLRAADGQFVWRFRAAPTDERIVAFGQIESVWPTSGAVLLQDGLAYVAAGRAPDADGGIRVHALEPKTGRVVWSQTVSQDFYGLCDYMVGDGRQVYLSNWQFHAKTGVSRPTRKRASYLRGGKVGLLEASWTRIEMALRKGIQDWTVRGVTGQLLAFSPETVYGYQCGGTEDTPGVLFAEGSKRWTIEVPDPIQIEAVLLSRNVLLAAGRRDRSDRESNAGLLWAVSRANGKKLGEMPLPAAPVFDGLAAAYGRLFVSSQDGRLLCFAGS